MPSTSARCPAALLSIAVCLLFLFVAAPAMAVSNATPHLGQGYPLQYGSISTAKAPNGDWTIQFPSKIDVLADGGQLAISGQRNDTSVDTMDAFQTIGSSKFLVGALQYNYDITHNHWHYLALDRYDLRPHAPIPAGTPVTSLPADLRDQKTGFCLVYTSQLNPTNCQQKNPSALAVNESIPNGGFDIYDPARDGQFIDIQGLAAGQYELVEWVNADCRLHDTGPGSHTWAQTVDISYSGSTPQVSLDSATPYWNAYWQSLNPSQQCLPAESVRPVVSGNAQVGSILSGVAGDWLTRMSLNSSQQFTYQWRRCDANGWNCADIPGANAQNYGPVNADVGHMLRLRVTLQNAPTMEQASPQDSEASAVVAAAPPPPPPPPPPGNPNTSPGGNNGGNTTPPTKTKPKIPVLTASLGGPRVVSIRALLRHGVVLRAHCSMSCKVRLSMVNVGGIQIARASHYMGRSGTRAYRFRMGKTARRILRNFHSGRVVIWLNVRSKDGEQQTVSRVIRLHR